MNEQRIKHEMIIKEDTDLESGYYLHKEKLGEGGFSKVRLATHLLTNQKVAIKCMDKNKLGEDLFRVKTEIQALQTLQHQNIAKLLQVIENDTKIYLVLEYCSGGELFDYIVSKSRLSETESRQIMRSLLECLAYLHSHGFAHRDLKPENILFDQNHNVKLIDFGLAAQSKDSTKSLFHLKTCCGSPAYAAPELIAGHEYSGPAVDVWGAGVILYALLVGQLPFDDENMSNLYRKIQAGQYKTPFWLSQPSKSVIASMLNTDPRKRISVKELLQHPWILNGERKNDLVAIQKHQIDEDLLFETHKYFPLFPLTQLRKNIATQFGYQTATFWLIKSEYERNPNFFAARKQSASVESVLDKITEESEDKLKKNQSEDHVLSPKPKLVAVHPKPVESRKHKLVLPPMNQPTPAKRVQYQHVASPYSKIPVKSPLRASTNASPINSPKPNKTDEMKTPMKQFLLTTQTPKRSLLKRFLATATPSASMQPRNITSSIHTSTSKNVTMTTFTDADECVRKLIESLTAKGIECKQKGFMIRCQLNNRYENVLNFNLEVCKYGDRYAIQRNRLRGDAWNYKKICEEILRISNQ